MSLDEMIKAAEQIGREERKAKPQPAEDPQKSRFNSRQHER